MIHCTAGWQNEPTKDVLAHFRSLGWKNNGYHFLISADGNIEQITHLDTVANGVSGFNSNSIHISYKGGVEKKDGKITAVDNRTDAQKQALTAIIKALKALHPQAVIKGHRDFSPDKNKNGKIDTWEYIKMCPCFDAMVEYKNL